MTAPARIKTAPLGNDELAALQILLRQGWDTARIGRALRRDRATIVRYAIRRPSLDEAVAAYVAGTTVARIGVAPYRLYAALHQRGIPLRSTTGPAPIP